MSGPGPHLRARGSQQSNLEARGSQLKLSHVDDITLNKMRRNNLIFFLLHTLSLHLRDQKLGILAFVFLASKSFKPHEIV